MRGGLVVCLISMACAAAGTPLAAAATTESPPRAALRGFACQRAANPLNRVIYVVAVMRPMTGTERMQVKFVLLRRPAGGGPFAPVQGGDLGRWRQPNPPTLGQRSGDVWRVKKPVANLAAPYVYRFRVTFRWTGASGAVLGHTVLLSPSCFESR